MKTLGVIGGIAPASTVIYYQAIIRHYRQQNPDGTYPSILINSIDLTRLLHFVEGRDLDGLTEFLLEEIGKLARAGANAALLASNTPHIVFDELEKRSPVPLISITKAGADAAKKLGLHRLGLFGTRFIMQADVYPRAFSAQGMEVVRPNNSEQKYIHETYMTELVHGVEWSATRGLFIKIAEDLRRRTDIDGLILGGCELSLVFPAGSTGDTPVPFIDMVDVHAAAAVRLLLCEKGGRSVKPASPSARITTVQ